MLIWFACVNGPFYRGTVSAFLHPTPGGLMLPIGHRCRMWGRSDIFGSSQRRLWLRFLRQVLGGFLFLLASEGCFLSLRLLASLARIPPFHQGRTVERESCEKGDRKKKRKKMKRRKREDESVLVKPHFHSTRLSALPRRNLWMSSN